MSVSNSVQAEISVGELIDKITILRIKSEKISEANKLDNIHRELTSLEETRSTLGNELSELAKLEAELKSVNESLWDIEDQIRDHERNNNFSDSFVELARRVYKANDARSDIKRKINELTGSNIVEEKSYQSY